MTDFIVVRKNMLAECFGAYLFQQQEPHYQIIETENLTEFTAEMIERVRDKYVIIVGGYYAKSYDQIPATVKVYLNSADPAPSNGLYVRLDSGRGFLSAIISQLKQPADYLVKIADYLDSYLYGFPSEEAINFQNGVYVLPGESNLAKILTIQNLDDVTATVELGRKTRQGYLGQVRERVNASTVFSKDGLDYQVSCGDTHIVDTCLALAHKSSSGVGLLIRYNYKLGKTFISIRVTAESGLNAGELAAKLTSGQGGGSVAMGGGSFSRLVLPEEIFGDK